MLFLLWRQNSSVCLFFIPRASCSIFSVDVIFLRMVVNKIKSVDALSMEYTSVCAKKQIGDCHWSDQYPPAKRGGGTYFEGSL